MFYINSEFSHTIEIKKSKFIAHLVPFHLFDETMKKLKMIHPKARHFVYAYRYINEFDQIVENCSDDGEPKGTSGKPSLKVLAGQELVNTAVIIVRYFGGIRLGTGGLVRAYGDAVNEVISTATLLEYKKLERRSLSIAYDILGKIEYLIEHIDDLHIEQKEFASNVELRICGTKESFECLKSQLPLGVDFDF